MDKHSKTGPSSFFWPSQVPVAVQSQVLMFCRKKKFGVHQINNNSFRFTVMVSDMKYQIYAIYSICQIYGIFSI